MPIISSDIMKIIDEREIEKEKKSRNEQRQKKTRRTEPLVKE